MFVVPDSNICNVIYMTKNKPADQSIETINDEVMEIFQPETKEDILEYKLSNFKFF